ncbi:hypothetical protein MMP65_05970 [Acinetobacter sp. ANC 3926]|uniref:hypothetical protein n=1 Tax=Acinetobacter genomosp. 15BJ TaxID=106651 RepID=UPI001F4BBDB1|nr:hypothetical protein [Acinetobacter genomosp. 15BJ]MCH7291007.1 hypothetical protein [Acinetobacter genomosp. 15BJ]
MRVKLSRTIHFHSDQDGFVSNIVFKEYDGVAPVIGAELDDSAWHRNDLVKIEKININTDEPDHYYVELTSKEVNSKEQVQKYVEIAALHGWKPLV